MARAWDHLLTDLDRQVYQEAGYGARGEGGKKPALLVIDVTYEFVGDKPEPILDSIKRFPNSCGEVGWQAMEHIRDLLQICHRQGFPVFYTKGMDNRTETTRGAWTWKKAPNTEKKVLANVKIANEIPDMIAPAEGDTVIQKTKPSGFFGTPLASYLTWQGVDTVLVTGTTTSGCVRATVLDAFSNNFRTIVVEEACFDRGQTSHAINLFDMSQKYAEVMPVAEVKEYLASVSPVAVATPAR